LLPSRIGFARLECLIDNAQMRSNNANGLAWGLREAYRQLKRPHTEKSTKANPSRENTSTAIEK